MGRPTLFNEALVDCICRRLVDGESLRKICLDEDMPDRHTVIRWKNENETFCAQYARAREDQGDTYQELGLEAALNAEDAAKGRLAWDAYRWTASKLKPGTYGDKVQHANAAGDGDQVTIVQYQWAEPEK